MKMYQAVAFITAAAGITHVYFTGVREGIIWGMTAKILRSLAEMYREDILSK